ncbi:15811_t:CDS:2 [Funneliformis mosseae]|uniref:15811_t:CDS:1 n=1 Tax=Funneliformis mosseae TaxID=27381 RepID=A0A9N8V9S3_FUNMO|nr:15811_t:CDS:2 [Funneliformis mosseae]
MREKLGTESESKKRYKTVSSTKDIPQAISEDASLHYAIAFEETIIPDPSPEIEHSRTKSEESEIQYSASPSANSLLEDDISK